MSSSSGVRSRLLGTFKIDDGSTKRRRQMDQHGVEEITNLMSHTTSVCAEIENSRRGMRGEGLEGIRKVCRWIRVEREVVRASGGGGV